MAKVTRVITFRDKDGERHTIERRVDNHVCALGLICASHTALAWFRTRKRFKVGGKFRTIDHRALVHVRPKLAAELLTDKKGS